MQKINGEVLKFVVNNNNCLYVLELEGSNIKLKKIEPTKKKVDIIKLSHEDVNFKRTIADKDYNVVYSDLEKDRLVNDILYNLDTNIVRDSIDLNYLSKSIKKHYIKNIIDNGEISLSLNNDKLSIVLLSTNSIIGEIIRDYDVRVRVDKEYLKDSLHLLSKYVLLNKKSEDKKELVKTID